MKSNRKIILIVILIVAAAVIATYFLTISFAAPQAQSAAVSAASTSESSASASGQAASQSPSPSLALPSGSKTPTSFEPSSPSPGASTITGTDPVQYKDNTIQYEYYDVSSDKTKTEKATVDDSSTLMTPLEIVAKQYFSKDLADSPVNPNSVKLQGGNVYIDFTSDIYKTNMGTEGQNNLLDSIAVAYLNNIDDAKAVYFSVNGENYQGELTVPKDSPYKTK